MVIEKISPIQSKVVPRQKPNLNYPSELRKVRSPVSKGKQAKH